MRTDSVGGLMLRNFVSTEYKQQTVKVSGEWGK
jgi:hypothetical protein